MPTRLHTASPISFEDTSAVAVYRDGIRAGLAGAATLALWFLLIDTWSGRPLYTPMVLGTALFHGSDAVERATHEAPSLDVVVGFTWVHGLLFLLVGMAVARLVATVERNPSLGFGIVILFAVFMAGSCFFGMLIAEPVLRALAWWAVVGGNILAAAAMGLALRRTHRHLEIRP